jgi:dethiobiotin synthetase
LPGLFVTATGTDVGKTYVTCGLLRAGRRAGVAVGALKPILSGYDPPEAARSDAGLLLAALGEPVSEAAVARVSPWRFAAPLSPNMAAAREGRGLDLAEVAATCRALSASERLVVIEGIGGVMVPLNEHETVLDLIEALALPVVLVGGTALGAISHCLTAREVLRARGRAPAIIVLDESAGSTVPLEATRDTLADFCREAKVVTLARNAPEAAFDALFRTAASVAS